METNVILIVCDTLRKDILQIYGGEAKTPNLNALKKDSMVYDNAIAPSPWTFPSHVSLFTGKYPSRHGVHETRENKVSELITINKSIKIQKLPVLLRELGYNTIGISNNPIVSRFTGFDTGFNQFLNVDSDPWRQSKVVIEALNLGSSKSQIAIKLLKQGDFGKVSKYIKELMRLRSLSTATNYPLDKGAGITNNIIFNSKLVPKFFLFVNLFDAHEPYKGYNRKERYDDLFGIRPITPKRAAYFKTQYIKEAEYIDKQLGYFIEMLKTRNLYENSLIIVTSDHGQSFNEHGFMYHSIYLYDEIIRIPLMIKYPNSKKFAKRKGYQSLVNLPKLINDVITGKDDKNLTTKFAFSEAFGNENFIPKLYANRTDYASKKYEKVRRAVYNDGYKLTINGTDGVIEEFLKDGKHAKMDKNKVKKLIKSLEQLDLEQEFKMPAKKDIIS